MARARNDDIKRSLSPLILDYSHSSSSNSSNFDSPRLAPLRFVSRRRRAIFTTAAALSALSLLVLAYISSSRPLLLVSRDPVVAASDGSSLRDRKSALLGPPTTRFRGSSQGYPTSFPP